jgi:phosphonate transport system ATP-binding protein
MADCYDMIRTRGLRKTFPPNTVALDGVDLDIQPGEFVMVIGQSGAGKSTLLRCLNRLIEPTAGEIALNGSRVTGATPEALRAVRRQMGMIFQQFNLVKRASVMENVLAGRLGHVPGLPSLFGRFPRKDRELALSCLRLVGLEDFAERRADRLSGGEQQRVAIARALAQEPKVILADEPTASLDPMLTESIMGILQRINRERGLTLVVSQHMLETARAYGTRIVGLRQGRVVFDGPPGAITPGVVQALYEGGGS